MVRIPTDFSYNDTPIVRSMFARDVYDWWGTMLNLEEVHKHVTGKGVQIAVLDTGYLAGHADLKDDVKFQDFTDDSDPTDFSGHGTHVRGLINMQPNGAGYVGVAPGADVHIGKVLDGQGAGKVSWLLKGLEWAIDNEFDWVNCSLSLSVRHGAVAKRIKQMYEKGIGATFAAGNDFLKRVSFPANMKEVIACGAHDAAKIPANFSNQGKDLDIVAPGVHVNSTWIDGNYKSASGSSMASPLCTGACALIIELERNLGA